MEEPNKSTNDSNTQLPAPDKRRGHIIIITILGCWLLLLYLLGGLKGPG